MKRAMMFDEEHVVLVDDSGARVGVAPKIGVHTTDTPLHLAFSCYLFNDQGHVLVTRRALKKRTWPGVWTNSFCGHPAPNESTEAAVTRRGIEELGTEIVRLEVALPRFRYRATDASGIVENEICPVYFAKINSTLSPNPDELSEWAWVSPDQLAGSLERTPFAFSPWMALQLPQLLTLSYTYVGVRT